MITLRSSRRHTALLPLNDASLALLLAASLSLKSASAQSVPLVTPAKLNDLKARLTREDQTAVTAARTMASFSLPPVVGRVLRREGGGVLIWGHVAGELMRAGKRAPEMFDDVNIFIPQPDRNGFQSSEFYSSHHFYLGQRSGRNAYGMTVPIYVYGNPPRAYYEEKRRMEEARGRVKMLGQTLSASFIARENARLKAHPSDRTLSISSARASLDLQQFLASRSFEAPELSRRAAVVWTQVATRDSRSGKLSNAMESLSLLMKLEPAKPRAFPPLPQQTEQQTRDFLGSLTPFDQPRSGNEEDDWDAFPRVVQDVHAWRADLYRELLIAWNGALPTFLAHANPVAKARALRWSRQLVNNADNVNLDVAVPIEAKLGQLRTQMRDDSSVDGEANEPFAWTEVRVSDSSSGGRMKPAGLSGVWVTSAPPLEEGERDYDYRLKPGDLLLTFNGQSVANVAQLDDYLRVVNEGQLVLVGVYRAGKRYTVRVTMR